MHGTTDGIQRAPRFLIKLLRSPRERYGIELVKGQLGDLSFDPQPFDVVNLWHVLEHLPSPSVGFDLCRSLLRPGGLLVIGVPHDSGAAGQFNG